MHLGTKLVGLCLFFITSIFNPLYSSTTVTNSKVLRVMNYNIKGLPLPWLKHKKRYLRIAKEIKSMRTTGVGPHVLSLQEAIAKKTKYVQKTLKYPYYKKGPKGKGFRANAGLETLSEFEIVEENEFVYKRCASFDCLSRKGVQHTRIRIPGMPVDIDFYVTHMQAGPTGDIITPNWYTTMVRELQAVDYFQFVNRTHNPNNLMILFGDFNFRQKSGLYHVFVDTLDVQDAAYDCSTIYACAGAKDPMAAWVSNIDHQFYQAPANGQVSIRPVYFDKLLHDNTGGKVLSDHDAAMVHYLLEW